jgi:hypothetical protein
MRTLSQFLARDDIHMSCDRRFIKFVDSVEIQRQLRLPRSILINPSIEVKLLECMAIVTPELLTSSS